MTKLGYRLKGDVLGGFSASIITFPASIICGLLVVAPLGADYIPLGVLFGITGAVVTSTVASLFGGCALQITGPRSSLSIIMASVLSGVGAAVVVPGQEAERIGLMLALMFLCVFMAGALQVLFGILRLGNVIKYVPHPVLAGLMNGLAVVVILKQLPVLFGAPSLSAVLNGQGISLAVMATGGLTLAVSVLSRRYIKWFPGSLSGLIVGSAAYHLIVPQAAQSVIGTVSVEALSFGYFAPLFSPLMDDVDLLGLMPTLLGAAVTIAFLSSILSLLNASVLDSFGQGRHDSGRELIGQGIANMASSVLGGVVGAGAPARSRVSYNGGGRTRLAGLFNSMALCAFAWGLSPIIGQIPLAVIASILIFTAGMMIDRQALRQCGDLLWRKNGDGREYFLPNLMIVVLVMILTVAVDFVVAAAVGLVSASFMFAMRMEKVVIRGLFYGDQMRSKTSRPRSAMDMLDRLGHAIVVFEAQGPIFFGSADQLARQIEQSLTSAEIVILDLHRVTEIDDTGLNILQQVDDEIRTRGKTFLLSHLSPQSPLWKSIDGLAQEWDAPDERAYEDTDGALSAAEDQLLDGTPLNTDWVQELPLAEIDMLKGLNAAQVEVLVKQLTKQSYPAGAYILRQGDETRDMYLIAAGTVSVTLKVTGTERDVRLSSLRPGVAFGEMGLINDEPRSTSVIADMDVTCYLLSNSAFKKLAADHPDILSVLLINMSREMSSRLRSTSKQVSELEQ